MPLGEKELEARNRISKEQDERIFAATERLMEKASQLGIQSVEVGGIKIVNGASPKPAVADDTYTLSKEHAEELMDAGIIERVDPLDIDPHANPDLFSTAEGGTPPLGAVLNGGA